MSPVANAVVVAEANKLLDASLGTAAYTATVGPIHVRLLTANGSNTAAGTELATGGGYTSGAGAPTVTFAAAASGSAASNAAVTITNMPAATITGIELWDSATVPLRKWQGALTASKTVAAGDTFQIAAGSLTVSIA